MTKDKQTSSKHGDSNVYSDVSIKSMTTVTLGFVKQTNTY